MKFDEWISADSPEKAEEYRRRFKMAIANSIRRKILLELDEGSKSVGELLSKLNVGEKILKYHLDTLEKGSCIRYAGDRVELTEEGRVLAKLVREKM
ncbi:MAG: winged helix-turn-helix transcriptional regulator [Archaeoglobi archaeon]|nr:winged helix-turn-helix transcriptional regulator [Archaeoglobi archaeon]